MHLAELNIGKFKHPTTDPRMAGFVGSLDRVNTLAERGEDLNFAMPNPETHSHLLAMPCAALKRLAALCFVAAFAFAPVTSLAEGKYRKVAIKLPQGYVDTLGASQYGAGNLVDGASYGFGCNPGEVVQTCDANTSITMPDALALYLGPAVNTVLFGAKRKTDCTAMAGTDRSGLSGCIYEGCLGYKKPVMMLCKSAGTGQ